ncbi:heme exporter protein CcmB [bacterium]|nr:heme exporter protein CcmB [bacterium]
MFGKIAIILWKDVLSELRTKEITFSMLVFSLMVALIVNFSFPPGSEFMEEAAPGILWMTFVFAGIIGMSRSFVYEVDKGCLQGLMLVPTNRVVIYISKFLLNFLFMALVELIILPVFSIFFRFNIMASFWPLLAVVLLSTIGFAVVGTLFSAISVNTRTREVMLPILHFPVAIPIIIGAAQSTAAIFQEQPWAVVWNFLKIVVVFDIVFFILALLTFEYIIEE